MKLLVHGASIARRVGRLRAAIGGVAARGHDVRWLGGDAPRWDGVTPIGSLRETHHWRPDLVLGEGSTRAVAWAAWRSHAGAMLLALRAEDFARASWVEALAWHLQPAFGLIDETDADAVRTRPAHVPLDRVALWPEAHAATTPDPTAPDAELLERACERLLALRTGRSGRPCVFLDRDGTLIVEEGYLGDPDRLRLLPGVARALRQLHAAGFALAVVSNQSGVGRGKFPLERAHATMARLRRVLREEGVELDAIRFCPHAPDAGCACRKPGTRLLEELAADLRLSLAGSVFVGDKRLDAATGRAMGGAGLLVRTGYGGNEDGREDDGLPEPDGVFDDVPAAAAWILGRYEER